MKYEINFYDTLGEMEIAIGEIKFLEGIIHQKLIKTGKLSPMERNTFDFMGIEWKDYIVVIVNK